MKNGFDVAHAGAMCALVDQMTCAAVYCLSGFSCLAVKLESEVQKSVPVEEDLAFEVMVNYIGKKLAKASTVIYRPLDNQVLSQGQHIMAIYDYKL